MSTKELALETIQELPENASWQEIEERIQFVAAIGKSREDVTNGRVVSHKDVPALLNGWISE
jgi:hypothetical protein